MQLKNNCTRNSQNFFSPRAITWLLLVQLFFNCTQMRAITYTNRYFLAIENVLEHFIRFRYIYINVYACLQSQF